MSYSTPLNQGWKLRVLTGSSQGREIDLPPAHYILGSSPAATIAIPHGSLAPQHVTLDVHSDRIEIRDCSQGHGLRLNGQTVSAGQAGPGDHIAVGDFEFAFINPGLAVSRSPTANPVLNRPVSWLRRLDRWQQVGVITVAIAAALYVLFAVTGNIIMVPATLLAMGLVVPATVQCYLIDKHDRTGISLRTLGLTFLAGGTVGLVMTVILALVGGTLSAGLLLLPFFAGVFEEPAKLLATSWRWKHPGYDRPLDGLILGTVSGFGFAVFETAGYGLEILLQSGAEGLLLVILLRSLGSPFGHGLWSGILAAAFWQAGRDPRRVWRDRRFLVALAWVVGLHALWNLGAGLGGVGLPLTAASAYLSLREYRNLLSVRGFR